MPKNTFRKRFDDLERKVGDGTLRGEIVVNQAYAAKQHNELSYNHPRGGGPHFVSEPLLEQRRDWIQHLARNVLDGDLIQAMADNMEEWADAVESHAPVDDGVLRNSAAPAVYDGHNKVYDRSAKAPRLPEHRRNYRPGWQYNRQHGRPGWPGGRRG